MGGDRPRLQTFFSQEGIFRKVDAVQGALIQRRLEKRVTDQRHLGFREW